MKRFGMFAIAALIGLFSFSPAHSQIVNPTNANNVLYTAPYTGAVSETQSSYNSRVIYANDFGASPSASAATNCSKINAVIANAPTNAVVKLASLASGSTYTINCTITLAGTTGAARLESDGMVTLQFTGLDASTDCVTITGASMRQSVIRNITIDCNNTGRDGLVIKGADKPILDNVTVLNAPRDGMALDVSASQYIENGEFSINIQSSGRNCIRQQLAGNSGAFINEILWKQIECRGVSQITAGAHAIYLTSTATSGASKFSNQNFIKTNFDAQYNIGGNAPSVNIVEIDSGNAEAFSVLGSHGWENTGTGTIGSGYAIAQTGTGTFTRPVIGPLVLAGWGLVGTNATTPWYFDYRNAQTYLVGPVNTLTNSQFFVYQSAGNSNATGDGTIVRIGLNGVSTLYNNHSDTVTNGVLVAPVTGVYTFCANALLTGIGAAHTFGAIRITVANGSFAGSYTVNSINPFANNDAGNVTIAGCTNMKVEEGNSIYADVYVTGGTKTVGVFGGSQGSSWFSGKL